MIYCVGFPADKPHGSTTEGMRVGDGDVETYVHCDRREENRRMKGHQLLKNIHLWEDVGGEEWSKKPDKRLRAKVSE